MALSSTLRDLLEREAKERDFGVKLERAKRVISACAEYLAPNSTTMFIGQVEPTEELIAAERNGDPDANLSRSREWVAQAWTRARQALLDIATPDDVAGWKPRDPFSAELHPVFVTFLRSDGGSDAVESASQQVATARSELGALRYRLGALFADLQGHVARRQPVRQTPSSEGSTERPATDGTSSATTPQSKERRRFRPSPAPGWIWQVDACDHYKVAASTLDSWNHQGKFAGDARVRDPDVGLIRFKRAELESVLRRRGKLKG